MFRRLGKAMQMNSLTSAVPALLKWYRKGARPLPWRQTKHPDPYHVWIAEVMSQQSTMTSVLPYFARWLERFPTVADLAAAPAADVLEHWAGLGYYSRARNVHKSAQTLDALLKKESRWPRSAEEWQSLPGIGPYTAAAIAAIAFGQSILPIDGNVIRVAARFFAIPNPLNNKSHWRQIEAQIQNCAQNAKKGQHAQLAQAFMELGSQICRPGSRALCELCPLRPDCKAYKNGKVTTIPQPKARPAPIRVEEVALVYRDHRGGYLLRQIPSGHHLPGQWELPRLALEAGQYTELQKHFEVSTHPVRHAITRYQYRVYRLNAGPWPQAHAPLGHVFWHPGEAPPGTLTTLTRKLLLKDGGI